MRNNDKSRCRLKFTVFSKALKTIFLGKYLEDKEYATIQPIIDDSNKDIVEYLTEELITTKEPIVIEPPRSFVQVVIKDLIDLGGSWSQL